MRIFIIQAEGLGDMFQLVAQGDPTPEFIITGRTQVFAKVAQFFVEASSPHGLGTHMAAG